MNKNMNLNRKYAHNLVEGDIFYDGDQALMVEAVSIVPGFRRQSVVIDTAAGPVTRVLGSMLPVV